MSAAVSIARMMRPPLGLLTALGAAASLAIIMPYAEPVRFAVIAAAVFCVTSGGFLVNDVFDVERDRVTHPERPLPSGRIRRAVALMAALAFLAVGLVAALPLGREAMLVVAANIALLLAYSPLKAWSGILGNVLTAYLCASIAILGSVVGGNIKPLLPAIVFVFFVSLARETILDLNDAEGDRAAGLRTVPLVFGASAAFRFTWIVMALLTVFLVTVTRFDVVARPFLFLPCLLGSLALFAVGLHRYQERRDAPSFASFGRLGRWAFAVSIPGFLAGGLPLAAQTPPPVPINSALPLPPGILAYALAGVGLVFFLIANTLITDYNRESQQMWTRIDARWRFYSLFTCLNYVFVFQCAAFALGRLDDLGQSWWAVFLFVNGFVPFPVVWLELVYTRNSKSLGFTRYYEQNCWDRYKKLISGYYSAQEASRRKEKPGLPQRLMLKLRFLGVWAFIYFITPLFGFHIRRNLRNPDLEEPRLQRLQTAQDILVCLTNWLFTLGLVAFTLGRFHPSFALTYLQPLAPGVMWAVFAIVVFSALLALFSWLLSWLQASDLRDGMPVLLLVAYACTLFYDFRHNGWLEIAPRFQFNFLESLESFGGGLTPWALLALLSYLIWLFLHQLREARNLSRLSATLADFALHQFGNLLTPPTLALQQVCREIESPEALARLGNDERRQEVFKQVGSGTRALADARRILLDLQSHARRGWNEHWYALSVLLREVGSKRAYSAHGVEREIDLQIDAGPPGLEVYVDREAFLDVLRNLVENARDAIEKALPQHGEIRMTAKHNPESWYALDLTVWDNGTGIPREIEQRIYDLGFTTKPRGSGIGLFLVWDFVQRLQGDIDLTTKTSDKTFTEFRLWFPRNRVRLRQRTARRLASSNSPLVEEG